MWSEFDGVLVFWCCVFVLFWPLKSIFVGPIDGVLVLLCLLCLLCCFGVKIKFFSCWVFVLSCLFFLVLLISIKLSALFCLVSVFGLGFWFCGFQT